MADLESRGGCARNRNHSANAAREMAAAPRHKAASDQAGDSPPRPTACPREARDLTWVPGLASAGGRGGGNSFSARARASAPYSARYREGRIVRASSSRNAEVSLRMRSGQDQASNNACKRLVKKEAREARSFGSAGADGDAVSAPARIRVAPGFPDRPDRTWARARWKSASRTPANQPQAP